MKKAVSLFVLFILISSLFTLAEDTAVKTPSFWEKISIWLFGTSRQETVLVSKAEGIWDGEIVKER